MHPHLYDKAVVFYNKGNYRKARRYLDRVIKKEGNNASAVFLKGQIAYSERNDLDSAIRLISKAIKLDATVSNYFLVLALIYTQKKEYSKAIQTLIACLALAPNDYQAMSQLADLYRCP